MCDCQAGCAAGGIDRREFLAGSTLAALGALLATACGGRIDFGISDPSGGLSPFTLKLSDYPQLATVGGVALVNGAPIPMAAARLDATTYAVFSLVCPHAGTTVGLTATGFRCPNHGATWDRSGTWIGGQATSGLLRLQSVVDTVAGTLTVQGSGGNVDLTIRIADFPALAAAGGLARVDGNTAVPIGVARLGPSSFASYGLACPHEQTTIDPTGREWRCPNHGARFAADGALLLGPAATGLTPLAVSFDPVAGTLRIQGSAVASKRGDDDD